MIFRESKYFKKQNSGNPKFEKKESQLNKDILTNKTCFDHIN